MSRPAGLPNKNKQALIKLLEAKYPGYHPVVEMAAIANNDVKCMECKGSGVEGDYKEADSETTSAPCDKCQGSGKERITMDMKFNADKEVAQYVTPKLKAVEHTGDVDHEIHVTWEK